MSVSFYTQNAKLFDKENAGKFMLRYNCVDNNFFGNYWCYIYEFCFL